MRFAALVIAALVGASGCTIPYTGGARSVKPAQIDDGWVRAAPTPVIKQRQMTDCGLAALAMVAGAWGRHWTVDDMTIRLKPGDHGIKLRALRDQPRCQRF